MKVLLFSYLVVGLINILKVSLDYMSMNPSSKPTFLLKSETLLVFLVLWIISVIVTIVLLSVNSDRVNVLFTIQHMLNVVYHLLLVKFELNLDEWNLESDSKNYTSNFRV